VPQAVAILTHPSGITINFILNAAEAAKSGVLMDVAQKHPRYAHSALAVRDVGAVQAW
jgi:lactoylglutathione lyase